MYLCCLNPMSCLSGWQDLRYLKHWTLLRKGLYPELTSKLTTQVITILLSHVVPCCVDCKSLKSSSSLHFVKARLLLNLNSWWCHWDHNSRNRSFSYELSSLRKDHSCYSVISLMPWLLCSCLLTFCQLKPRNAEILNWNLLWVYLDRKRFSGLKIQFCTLHIMQLLLLCIVSLLCFIHKTNDFWVLFFFSMSQKS